VRRPREYRGDRETHSDSWVQARHHADRRPGLARRDGTGLGLRAAGRARSAVGIAPMDLGSRGVAQSGRLPPLGSGPRCGEATR
jgi:hypothetical protein